MAIMNAMKSGINYPFKSKILSMPNSGLPRATYSSIPTGTPSITTRSDGKIILNFTGSGSITIDIPGYVEVLLIGGGAGGQAGGGSGGGAGGQIYLTNLLLDKLTYTLVVGGAGGSGTNGSDSYIRSTTMVWPAYGGISGGCNGGSSFGQLGGCANGGSGITTTITGSSVTYGGGGGAGGDIRNSRAAGAGGSGGGGNGDWAGTGGSATIANSGSGGGGGGYHNSGPGAGGSGANGRIIMVFG